MDRWRWGVFSGEYEKVDWMHAWMELSEKYQGIVPPALRHYDDFDPGAKFEKRIFCLLRFNLKKNCFTLSGTTLQLTSNTAGNMTY